MKNQETVYHKIDKKANIVYAELDIEKQMKTAPVEEKAEKPSILARLQTQRNQPAVSNPKKNINVEEVL